MSHSPGPWVAERDRAKSISLYSDKTFVGEIYCEQDEPSDEELANVRLAAAAPDMLEALEDFIAAGTMDCCCGETPCCGSCTITMAKNAVKKARGE